MNALYTYVVCWRRVEGSLWRGFANEGGERKREGTLEIWKWKWEWKCSEVWVGIGLRWVADGRMHELYMYCTVLVSLPYISNIERREY